MVALVADLEAILSTNTTVAFRFHQPLLSRFNHLEIKTEEAWDGPRTGRKLREGMFVAQVQGRSMEPRIPDGAWCLFHSPVVGSREGRIVLAAHHSVTDAEHGGRYTVKVYHSEKVQAAGADEGRSDPETWRHGAIELRPINPEFEVLSLSPDDEVAIVAELIEVL